MAIEQSTALKDQIREISRQHAEAEKRIKQLETNESRLTETVSASTQENDVLRQQLEEVQRASEERKAELERLTLQLKDHQNVSSTLAMVVKGELASEGHLQRRATGRSDGPKESAFASAQSRSATYQGDGGIRMPAKRHTERSRISITFRFSIHRSARAGFPSKGLT